MEPILVILAVLAVALIAGTFYVVNRTTGRRGPDLEPPSRGGVLAPPRPEGGVVVEERPPVTEPEVLEPEVLEPVRKPSLRDRLAKARSTFAGFLGRTRIDEETWDELEEALIRADLGVGPTTELLDQLRARVKDEGLETGEQLVEALKTEMKAQLQVSDRALRLDDGRTNVWLFVGVNGVGKTTTIGKLGKRLVGDGHQVVMAAGDTFRAAARHADLVLADTAGRLHTKTNLMEELRKVRRVADKDPGHVTEVLLVIDATTGQNGLVQARQFTEATEVTGVVLTKLDGSAKGGIVFAIHQELGIPVKLVGLGETADDLVDFDPDEFVEGLLAV